ncbi:MAG: pilus assembly protein [Betaproteobacteria bacterium]|nr:pilus assembly protein [Betaproteobacteria bacterium]
MSLYRRSRLARWVRGQGMTEYIVVVALIAVSAIGVYSLFGQTIRSQVAGLAAEMAGQSASTSLQAAKKSADEAVSKADNKHGLNDYYAENH